MFIKAQINVPKFLKLPLLLIPRLIELIVSKITMQLHKGFRTIAICNVYA